MKIPLPREARRAIKNRLRWLRRPWVRWRYAFGPRELLACLRGLGVREGDVVLVHCVFDRFEGFSGSAVEVIGVLQEAVGPAGTLLMPTIPFTGTAVDYVRSGIIFDVRRTPSAMGIVSELFRRMPGVVRSLHPTHPVAAWGRLADALIADHHRAASPCGRGSPYWRILEHDGRILLLGTGIGAMTFFHTAEEWLEPRMPFSPFARERFCLVSRSADGCLVEAETRLFDPGVARRRNLGHLIPVLKARGMWRESRVGNLNVSLLGARDALETLSAMAQEGRYCYDA